MTMKRLRAAVFGTGFVGRVHLEAIARLGFVEVYAIGTTDVEKTRRVADEFGVEKVASDWKKLLQDPNLDAVHICTPNSLHHAMAKTALENGKHVVCEKPLTTSVEEAKDLVELAAKT